MSDLRIVRADLDDARHQAAVLEMTRAYARAPMGNGRDLPDDVARERSLGFTGGQYEPAAGAVLFRQKPL